MSLTIQAEKSGKIHKIVFELSLNFLKNFLNFFPLKVKNQAKYTKLFLSLGAVYMRGGLARLVGSRCLNNFLLFFLCVYMEKRAGSVSEISPEGRRDPGWRDENFPI